MFIKRNKSIQLYLDDYFKQRNVPFYCVFNYDIFGIYTNNLNFINKIKQNSQNESEIADEDLIENEAFSAMANYFLNIFSKQNENLIQRKIRNNILGISFILHLLLSYISKLGKSIKLLNPIFKKLLPLIEIFDSFKNKEALNNEIMIEIKSKLDKEFYYFCDNQEILDNLVDHLK